MRFQRLVEYAGIMVCQSRTAPKPAVDIKTNQDKLTTCFSDLPIELRLICYEVARPEARVFKLSLSKHHKPNDWSACWYSGAMVPNLLHVCKESRDLALKWYKASFGPKHQRYTSTRGGLPIPSFYFDCSRDYLYAQCSKCNGSGCDSSELSMCDISLLDRDHRDLTKRLFVEFSGFSMTLWLPLIWFRNLEHVKCVHWENGLLFRHEAKLSDFIETEGKYHWQEGKTMRECFEAQGHKMREDDLGDSIRGVKSFAEVALRQPNKPSDVFQHTKIQWFKDRATRSL
ncbi:hypothetical protein ONS95_000748 [Cadophora gregata]|uniref:uncharacterized protein n=1 Tax=Cadophora gregata TaxID=51156 RepID=UPI0026DA929D|nr:uncharacterized protein ONS95_000748 [Cadophora gregata]KAK0128798.1 hypothetical protein ONS95_000748 [Cadophora gregata]